MMKLIARALSLVALGGVSLGGIGCAADSSTDEPADVLVDTSSEQQLITSVNADGTWTANAMITNGTGPFGGALTASAAFTGPAGKTRRMGVCLLKQAGGLSGVACNTVNDCANAPATLPTGGFRYCTAPNGVGQKRCYFRPGAQTSFCAGTPANGGIPVAPQTLSKTAAGTLSIPYISYACFEGCAATDPSSSSAAYALPGSGGCYDEYGRLIPC